MLLLIVILIVITLGKLDNTKVPSGLLKGLLHVCEKCLYVQEAFFSLKLFFKITLL